ncbi:MAG: hypothetical protein MUO26_07595 [Methanotrichaceae archaeon]|nr:hypothetical protein [Methanotrichaceae archaeon]
MPIASAIWVVFFSVLHKIFVQLYGSTMNVNYRCEKLVWIVHACDHIKKSFCWYNHLQREVERFIASYNAQAKLRVIRTKQRVQVV